MLKKTLLIISLLLPMSILAQLGVGSWEVFPTFREVDKLIETPSKVYCLSAGTLTSYDMDNDESYIYGIDNILTEPRPSNIYYSPYGKYLAVAHVSGGIDIIYDNGKHITLPDIKDAILNVAPGINDISFAPGLMAVATNFGIVIYDDKKMEVIQSGIYNTNIDLIGISPEVVAIYTKNDKKLSFAKLSDRLNTMDRFNAFASPSSTVFSINSLNGDAFLIEGDNTGHAPRIVHYNAAENKYTTDSYGKNGFIGMSTCKDGFFLFGKNGLLKVDLDGNYTDYPLHASLAGQKIALWDDFQRVWAGDSNGIAQYSFDGSNITTLVDKIRGNVLTCDKVGNLTMTPSGRLYISHEGKNGMYGNDWAANQISYINLLENGKIKDVTPSGLTLLNTSRPGAIDGTYRTTDTYNIIEDPDDPNTYYVASWYDGLFKIRDGKEVIRYGADNSSLQVYAGAYRSQHIDIDGKGNLFQIIWNNKGRGLIHMLPASARKKDTCTEDDWVRVYIDDTKIGSENARILACKKSNIVLGSYCWWGLAFLDTKGTVSTADDRIAFIQQFTDQDGKTVQINDLKAQGAFLEDSKGQVWYGYEQGLFVIPDPSKFMDADFRVRRVKVPRNDGTGFADYLLDGENVICIAEDGQGRKWIGTQNAGAYLVSPDGTEIIDHFTTANSYLPSNSIFAIACDPNSNAVYFGTTDGLIKYNSDAAPGAPDYSDVYAYPNPVRPEYNGWITIKGLMDNSLVKIADAAGNVFYQGESKGGMMTWDGCDASGNRVKTGVYYVFASQPGGDSSSAVTKILVVK